MTPLPGRAPQATVLALQCLLSGSWRSNAGCRMVVSVLGKDGSFSGSYLPGPAAGNSEILTSPLEGSQQDARLVPQPTFSFTVRWRLRGRQEGAITLQWGCQRDAGGWLRASPSGLMPPRTLTDSETVRMTAFLGQCYVGTNGEETLHALWLLREAADSPAEDWKATR